MSQLTETDHTSVTIPRDSPGSETKGSDALPIGTVLRRMRGQKSLRDVERDTGIANSHLCNVESWAASSPDSSSWAAWPATTRPASPRSSAKRNSSGTAKRTPSRSWQPT